MDVKTGDKLALVAWYLIKFGLTFTVLYFWGFWPALVFFIVF